MTRNDFPKIGLALGSGGAKGLAHIGVIKTLEAYSVPINFIAGSSIGALIGAHYAAFKNTKKLEEFILNFNKKQGFKLFDPTLQGGFIKGKKFEKFISEMLEGISFENVQIPFAAVATDFDTAKPITFTTGSLTKAVRASTSVPAIFQPVIYKESILADGGLSNPVPVDIVRKMGADIVIAVNLDTVYETRKPPSLTKVPMHSINILRHNLALESTKTADVVISPDGLYQVGLIGWKYFFSTEKAKMIIDSGAKATKDVIPHIQVLISEKLLEQSTVPWRRKFFNLFKKFPR